MRHGYLAWKRWSLNFRSDRDRPCRLFLCSYARRQHALKVLNSSLAARDLIPRQGRREDRTAPAKKRQMSQTQRVNQFWAWLGGGVRFTRIETSSLSLLFSGA